MADYVCNTSPLQYLHQVGRFALLPSLLGHVLVPSAVVAELATGRALGVDLPDLDGLDWITVRSPAQTFAVTSSVTLGLGEIEVIALTLECGDAVAVLDDRAARLFAQSLGLRVIGTLGLVLDAKHAGLLPAVKPVLDELRSRRFRLALKTREAVLRLAGELP